MKFYSIVLLIAILLLAGGLVRAADLQGGYALSLISQGGLESQLNYSFQPINATSWNVEWQWVDANNLTMLLDYLNNTGPLPDWVQQSEADNATHLPVTPSNDLIPSVSTVNETALNGSFELNVNESGLQQEQQQEQEQQQQQGFQQNFRQNQLVTSPADLVDVGLDSALIALSTNGNALSNSYGRKILDIGTCNGIAVAYLNGSSAFIAVSNDSGVDWTQLNVSANGVADDGVTITQDAAHDLFVAYDAANNNVNVVNVSKNTGCDWTNHTPIVVGAGENPYSDGMVALTACGDDSLHLNYFNTTGASWLYYKVCRGASVDCNNPTNWISPDNMNPYWRQSGTSYIGFASVCDANNNVYVIGGDANPPHAAVLSKWFQSGAGVWRSEYVSGNLLNGLIDGTVISLTANSTGDLFIASRKSGVVKFSYCAHTLNCSQANSWTNLAGTAASVDSVSNPAQTAYNPSISYSRLNPALMILYTGDDLNPTLDLFSVQPNSTGNGWSTPSSLTDNAYGNNFASAEQYSLNSNVFYAWVNGTIAPYQLLFNSFSNGGFGYSFIENHSIYAFETVPTGFQLNLTVNTSVYDNAVAELVWNSSVFSPSVVNSSTTYNYSVSITPNLLSMNDSIAPFYWSVNLTYVNGSVYSFNLSVYSQVLFYATFFNSFNVAPNPALTNSLLILSSNVSNYGSAVYSVMHYVNGTATSAPTNFGGLWNSSVVAPNYTSTLITLSSLNVSFNGANFIRNSSSVIVNVTPLNIAQCTNGNVILNFTVEDASTFTPITANHEATFVFYVSDIAFNTTINASVSNASFFAICLNNNAPVLKVRSFQLYDNMPNYYQKAFFLLDATVNNGTTDNVTLYIDNSSSAFLTSVTVLDSTGVPVKQEYVQFLRWYPALNQYLLDGMVVTDNSGMGTTYLVPNDVWYHPIVLTASGSVSSVLSQQQIFCASSSCAATLHTTSTVSGADFWAYNGKVLAYCGFNNVTSVFTCYVDDTSSTLQHFILTVQKVGYFANSSWCTQNLYSSAGSMSCVLDNSSDEFGFSIQGIGSDVPILQGFVVPTANDLKYGVAGLFMALVLFIALAFAGLYSPSAAMVLGSISLVISSYLGFYLISASSLAVLLVAVFIFVIKMRQ